MNNEIKEILDKLKDDDWYDELDLTGDKWIELKQTETKQILDYITNLQHQISLMEEDIRESKEINGELQQENERLKEENKHIFANVNDELLISNAMNYVEAQDYKSRCEKAIEYMQENYNELTDYGYKKEIYDDLLNILQNRVDKNENIKLICWNWWK